MMRKERKKPKNSSSSEDDDTTSQHTERLRHKGTKHYVADHRVPKVRRQPSVKTSKYREEHEPGNNNSNNDNINNNGIINYNNNNNKNSIMSMTGTNLNTNTDDVNTTVNMDHYMSNRNIHMMRILTENQENAIANINRVNGNKMQSALTHDVQNRLDAKCEEYGKIIASEEENDMKTDADAIMMYNVDAWPGSNRLKHKYDTLEAYMSSHRFQRDCMFVPYPDELEQDDMGIYYTNIHHEKFCKKAKGYWNATNRQCYKTKTEKECAVLGPKCPVGGSSCRRVPHDARYGHLSGACVTFNTFKKVRNQSRGALPSDWPLNYSADDSNIEDRLFKYFQTKNENINANTLPVNHYKPDRHKREAAIDCKARGGANGDRISEMKLGLYQASIHAIMSGLARPNSKGRGILVWHSTGSGKTATAAGVMDAFWDTDRRIIFMTSSEALASNGPAKLAEEARRFWPHPIFQQWRNEYATAQEKKDDISVMNQKHSQIMGRFYRANEPNFDKRSAHSGQYENGRVIFMSFSMFCNQLRLLNKAENPSKPKEAEKHHYDGNEKSDKKWAKNAVIIIDEVHVLFDKTTGDRAASEHACVWAWLTSNHPEIMRNKGDNMKIVILTATPGDEPESFIDLVNIVRDPNKSPIVRPVNTKESMITFKKSIRGLVSYIDLQSDRTRLPAKLDANPLDVFPYVIASSGKDLGSGAGASYLRSSPEGYKNIHLAILKPKHAETYIKELRKLLHDIHTAVYGGEEPLHHTRQTPYQSNSSFSRLMHKFLLYFTEKTSKDTTPALVSGIENQFVKLRQLVNMFPTNLSPEVRKMYNNLIELSASNHISSIGIKKESQHERIKKYLQASLATCNMICPKFNSFALQMYQNKKQKHLLYTYSKGGKYSQPSILTSTGNLPYSPISIGNLCEIHAALRFKYIRPELIMDIALKFTKKKSEIEKLIEEKARDTYLNEKRRIIKKTSTKKKHLSSKSLNDDDTVDGDGDDDAIIPADVFDENMSGMTPDGVFRRILGEGGGDGIGSPKYDYRRYIIVSAPIISAVAKAKNIESSAYISFAKAVFNHPENKDGRWIRLIIAADQYKQSLDLAAVRHVHIMEPLLQFSDDRQVMGRAIRNCSHKDLPYEEWNVTVHRYFSILPSRQDMLNYYKEQMDKQIIEEGVRHKLQEMKTGRKTKASTNLSKTSSVKKNQTEVINFYDKYLSLMQSGSGLPNGLYDLNTIEYSIQKVQLENNNALERFFKVVRQCAIDCQLFKEFHGKDVVERCTDYTKFHKSDNPFFGHLLTSVSKNNKGMLHNENPVRVNV